MEHGYVSSAVVCKLLTYHPTRYILYPSNHKENKMSLSPDQDVALDAFLQFLVDPSKKNLIITAPPGRGKTHLTKHLIQKAHDMQHMLTHLGFGNNGIKISVNATTNKAAEVLAHMLGTEVRTIHSTLGLIPKMDFDTWKEVLIKTGSFKVHEPQLFIIDECGSVNKQLLAFIQVACRKGKILWIGDDAQTSPVGETFCPVFEQGYETLHLTTNHRNSGPIGDLGDLMRKAVYDTMDLQRLIDQKRELVDAGMPVTHELAMEIDACRKAVRFPDIVANGDSIVRVDGTQFESMVSEYYKKPHSADELKILAWRNDLVIEYNTHVRTLHTMSDDYLPGEMVVTNKAIVNFGDIFCSTDGLLRIHGVDSKTKLHGVSGNWITVEHRRRSDSIRVFQPDDQNDVKALMKYYYNNQMTQEYYDHKDLFVDLRPTHSCTIHKSQGSTYGTVFLNLDDIGSCQDMNAVARMLNTGITRAKDRLVIYGHLPDKYRG